MKNKPSLPQHPAIFDNIYVIYSFIVFIRKLFGQMKTLIQNEHNLFANFLSKSCYFNEFKTSYYEQRK